MQDVKKIGVRLVVLLLVMGGLIACKPEGVPAQDGGQKDTATWGGEDQVGENRDQAIIIKAVIKDMSPEDEVSTKFLSRVSAGVSKQTGKNIQVDLVPISEGTYAESMGLLIQSGKIPDLMYFQGGDYQFAITQQVLEDLNPYIQDSEYVKQMLQASNKKRLENYPYLLWLAPERIKVPLVREDWFHNTVSGQTLLADPSPENYLAFFKEVKEKNNAKAACTVPGDISELDTIFNAAFGLSTTWLKEGDTYVYSKVTPGEKNKLAFYAGLYQAGLLDNEWLSKKWDTKEQAFYNGQVAVVAGTAGPVVNIYNTKMIKQNGENAKLMVLPPAKGINQSYTASNISKETRGWAISAYSDHKAEAFAVLEYMASPEGQILDKLGYEGDQYRVENGEYTLTEKMAEWYPRFHESTATLQIKFNPNTPFFSEPAQASLDKVGEYIIFDNAFVIPSDYITNWDAGQSLYLEYAADVISGKKSIDTFDDFVERWYQTVGPEITEYANRVIE